MKNKSFWLLVTFTIIYLLTGTITFLQNFNLEFVIYIVVLLIIFSGVLLMQKTSQWPLWMLWLLSFWGLLHILGGSVDTRDGVLFAYHIYPFIDLGGEFYILKYDQVVHSYLYGVVAVMAYHLLRSRLMVTGNNTTVFFFAVMASLGVSGLNEIMEFFISLTMENGVGGYDNTMLDMCFNLGGAVIATWLYTRLSKNL